jgi:CRISPR-associated protein Cst1
MEKYVITLGDFLKNAGIVGFHYMLETAGARENIDFGHSEDDQALWVSMDFAKNADWTDMYFKAFIRYFGPFSTYQGIKDKIQICIEKIEAENWNPGKQEKDDLKFINDKLQSNSYQAGFANIQKKIENPEIYEKLKKNKLSDKLSAEELKNRLEELLDFINQPECSETFAMKSIIYTYINRFWNGKCFLLRPNAKKDMREVFEKDFSEPFRKYLSADHKKSKDLCIDCGDPIGPKEKVSIAFMNEVGDDFTRKRSAFWNCKVDAFLCPGCAFIYALSPLGFRLYANKFVFVNINDSISTLLYANHKKGRIDEEGEKTENKKYSQWFAETINILLKEKQKELSNVQVILRGVSADDRYVLSIIHRRIIEIIREPRISDALTALAKAPVTKVRDNFINIHETVVMNLLQHREQYQLLNCLFKENIKEESKNFYIFWVYEVQLWTELVVAYSSDRDKRREISMSCGAMKKSGADLRKAIMAAKGMTSSEGLRGIEYQLLNALAVRNVNKFMDVVMRLYSAYGSKRNEDGHELLIPTGFVQMLNDKQKFTEYGYAFVMGLVGSYEPKKEEA